MPDWGVIRLLEPWLFLFAW